MDKAELLKLKKGSAAIRLEAVKMLKWRRYGHLGGAMSIIELLSVLYNKQMKHDPKNPKWDERDYVVLSKGHAGPGLYATLAVQGYFEKDMLYTLNEGGTNLPSHPDRTKTPGVDATTGSLGQGTSVAAGLAYSIRMEKSSQKVYLIVGDGELNEGQCWEAFQFIAHNKLNEVIVVIDWNKKQLDGPLEEILNPFSIAKKMEAFGFHVVAIDGHDFDQIEAAFETAKQVKGKPIAIVMTTTKGKGVSFMEGKAGWHGKAPNDAEYEQAMGELKALLAEVEAE